MYITCPYVLKNYLIIYKANLFVPSVCDKKPFYYQILGSALDHKEGNEFILF